MSRRTLVITREELQLNKKLDYFYDKGYLAIKFFDGHVDASEIENIAQTLNDFDDIFDAFIRVFLTDDGVNLDDCYYNELEWNDHSDKISLVEFIKRLKLSTFIIYHIHYFDFGANSHFVCFENGKVAQNGKFARTWKRSNFKAFK